MTILKGEVALDFMFGGEWRKLNAATAARYQEIADTYKIPCSRPGCTEFACCTVEIRGVDSLVCNAHIFDADTEEE